MTQRVLLGMLTPSSNTVLEPVTSAMLAGLQEVSVHFSRFRVTEISDADRSLNQFEFEPILAAARLLADAHVQVIGWNGTSASWLGFERDKELCARITAETGIPATTSVLALNEALALSGAQTLGLVTPYIDAIQQPIIANYKSIGITCPAERHLDESVNFAFSEFGPEILTLMIREVAASKPDAITALCTNLRAAPLVEALEAETGIPIYDSIATVLWKSLSIAGVDPSRIRGWGKLFSLVPTSCA